MPQKTKAKKSVLPKRKTVREVRGPIVSTSKIEMPPIKTGLEIGLAEALIVAVIGLAFSFYLALSAFPNQTVTMSTLAAGTYYVNCSVSANGSGTSEASPFNSINYAIQNVSSGSMIIVKPGNCSAEGRIIVNKSNLIIAAETKGSVITKGFTIFNTANWQAVSNVTIKNFNITGTGSDEISGPGIIIAGSGNSIIDNHIYQTTRQGIYVYGSDYDAANNTISGNTVETSGLGFTDMNAIGILVYGAKAQGNIVYNNQVANNNQTGIAVFAASSNTVSSNIVFNNAASGIHISSGAANNVIEKNKVYSNCLKMDDVWGIDLLQVGNNNIVRYNAVYGQHDTINDSAVGVNPASGGTTKFGTGGIRFDGGIPNSTIWNASGNKAYYNLVYNERSGIAVLNFDNIEISNNTLYNFTDSGIYLMAYNDAKTNFSGLAVKNNIVHTAKYAVNFIVRPENAWSGTYPIFSNNIYYSSSGTQLAWTLADLNYIQSLTLSEWKNKKTVTGWTRLSADSNVWFVAEAKNPAVVYFNSVKGSRKFDVASLQVSGCSNSWSWVETNGQWYLAVCSASQPSNIQLVYADLASGSEANSKDANPLLKSAGTDFDLAASSPAINAGVALGWSSVDILGRALVGVPDIGAYEYGSQSACSPNCTGKVCGDNGCGGSCGSCLSSQSCSSGQCVTNCTPATCAALGKNCGSQDDGCGGSLNCGACTAAQTCTSGVCKTKTCTDSACCKAKNSSYPYYKSSSKKCCRSSSIFASCIAP